MRSAIVVLLAAMSLVFSGCFQDDPAPPPDGVRRLSQAGLGGLRSPAASPEKDVTLKQSRSDSRVRHFAFAAPGYQPSPQELDLPRVIAPGSAPRLLSASSTTFANYRTRLGSNRQAQRGIPAAAKDLAGLSLNTSFDTLFASLMGRRDAQSGNGEDLPNPFTEAKKSIEAAKARSAPTSSPPSGNPSQTLNPKEGPTASSTSQSSPEFSFGGIGVPESRLIFLGDFDGSGILRYSYAKRAGDATFTFDDASRTFVIFNNQSAVESQRSFAVEDMDGDGNADLLQTSRAALFGTVLLGDGGGNFRYANYFLTAYEPTVAVPGPMQDNGRDIVSVDLRTGSYTVFLEQGLYIPYRQGFLGLVPDYLTHLMELGTGLDFLSAAQTGSAPHVFKWLDGDSLSEVSHALPGGPSIAVDGDRQLDGALGSLQVYQTGTTASVVLSNYQGQSFNVANLRVSPQIFLVIGDIERGGTLDVGVAFLLSAVPRN